VWIPHGLAGAEPPPAAIVPEVSHDPRLSRTELPFMSALRALFDRRFGRLFSILEKGTLQRRERVFNRD
jgi:hypothetical protein